MSSRPQQIHFLAAVAALALSALPAARAQTYTVTDLGTTGARDINNSGQIVIGDTIYQNGNLTTIPSATNVIGNVTTTFSGISINDAGQVTGNLSYHVDSNPGVYDAHTNVHVGLYSGGVTTDLQATDVAGNILLYAQGLNSGGSVVGWGEVHGAGAPALYPTAYASAYGYLGLTDTATLRAVNSDAWAINSAGTVVGNTAFNTISTNSYASTLAFSYNSTSGYTNLGAMLGWNFSTAAAINDSGVIAGYGTNGLWVYNGSTFTVPGPNMTVTNISNSGLVVGYGNDGHAYSYLAGAADIVDLNTLLPANSGWVLRLAFGVNDAGQIVGEGYDNGVYTSFLLTPIPEPATYAALLGAATLAVALFRRRHKQPTAFPTP